MVERLGLELTYIADSCLELKMLAPFRYVVQIALMEKMELYIKQIVGGAAIYTLLEVTMAALCIIML